MARRHKSLQVAFYVVEPRDLSGTSPGPTFEPGKFPAPEVLRQIHNLDVASGDFYMETSLFDQVVCFRHGEETPILGAYTKDVVTEPMTEYKGELTRLMLRDDEGIVDSTFVAFFPNSVAGVLRCSVKAPGPATVAVLAIDARHESTLRENTAPNWTPPPLPESEYEVPKREVG